MNGWYLLVQRQVTLVAHLYQFLLNNLKFLEKLVPISSLRRSLDISLDQLLLCAGCILRLGIHLFGHLAVGCVLKFPITTSLDTKSARVLVVGVQTA